MPIYCPNLITVDIPIVISFWLEKEAAKTTNNE